MANKSEIWLEFKRQLVHALGVLAIIPLVLFTYDNAVKACAIFVLIALGFNYWHDKRQERHGFFKALLSEMKFPSKDLLKKAEQAEEGLLRSFFYQFKRQRERHPFFATFSFLLAVLLCLIVFGQAIAIIACITLSFGDAISTVIGKKYGAHKIFWAKPKSVEGSLAFFITSFSAILIFLYYFPQYTIYSPFATALVGAGVGAFVETLPANDNSSVPLITGFALWLLSLI